MNGRHHLVSGAASLATVAGGTALVYLKASPDAAGAFVSFAFQGFSIVSPFTALCVAAYVLGTVLPDVDSPSSPIARHGGVPFKHRTWMHSLWPVVLLAAAGWFARPLMWLAAGYFVHLFWDSLSRMGVCWLYPHPGFIEYGHARVKRNHWLWFYHNGTAMETATCWSSVVIAAIVWVVVAYFSPVPPA